MEKIIGSALRAARRVNWPCEDPIVVDPQNLQNRRARTRSIAVRSAGPVNEALSKEKVLSVGSGDL